MLFWDTSIQHLCQGERFTWQFEDQRAPCNAAIFFKGKTREYLPVLHLLRDSFLSDFVYCTSYILEVNIYFISIFAHLCIIIGYVIPLIYLHFYITSSYSYPQQIVHMSILDSVSPHSRSMCRLRVFSVVWRTQLKQKDCQCRLVRSLFSVKQKLFWSCHV